MPSDKKRINLTIPDELYVRLQAYKNEQGISSDASAFCSDSWMVRPMAIASPTDFIAVVSSGFDPGNFSKAKRGILVTT